MNRRNNMKRIAIPLLLSLSLLLSGCQNTDTGSNGGDSASTGAESVAVIDTAALFSDRDLDGSYDESAAVHIQLEGETAVCDSDAVSIDGSRITLLDEGTYLVSGALTDGQIVVDAGDTDKVQIVLASASLTCADSAAIYSKSADKVFLTLAEGTENTLTNGGSYTAIDKNNIDSVVFSKTDLTLNGSGSLTIDAQAGHGVVSKDELTINGGTFTVDSIDDCLHSGGALAVTGGTFTLSSGDDAIHSDDAVTIRAGEFSIPYCYEGVEGLSVDVFNEGQIVLFIAVDVAVKRGKGTGMLGIRTEETVFDDGVAFFQRLLIRCAGKFRSVLDDGLDPVVDNAFKKSK